MRGQSVFDVDVFMVGSLLVRPGLSLFHLIYRLRQNVGEALHARHESLPWFQTHIVNNDANVHITRANVFTQKTYMGINSPTGGFVGF